MFLASFSDTDFVFLFSGMPLPINQCAAGYFCRRNATTASPNQGEDANLCPIGHYCPKGTGEPNNCPLGTFGNDTGLYVFTTHDTK